MTDSIIIQGAREHNLNNMVAPGATIVVSPWPGLGLAPFQKSTNN